MTKTSSPLTAQARRLARVLDKGEFPEELEPHYVAWLLRELVKKAEILNNLKKSLDRSIGL